MASMIADGAFTVGQAILATTLSPSFASATIGWLAMAAAAFTGSTLALRGAAR